MKEKKTEHLTITLTPSEKALIIEEAERVERKPSDLVYRWVKEFIRELPKI